MDLPPRICGIHSRPSSELLNIMKQFYDYEMVNGHSVEQAHEIQMLMPG